MKNSITLLGSSSGRNAGDAALMSGIMDSIDEAMAEQQIYEIPTINKKFVSKTYKNITKPIGLMPWNLSAKIFGLPTYQSIMRTDLSLVFDAVLFDRSLYNPLFNFLSTFYAFFPIAKRKGKKLALFNCTAGPVRTQAGKKMLKTVCELCDFITVRDQGSYDVLMNLGVKNPNILVTADAALNSPLVDPSRVDEILNELGISKNEEILTININAYIDTWADGTTESMGKEKFLRVLSQAINQVLSEIENIQVMFVSTQHLDVSITKDLMSLVKTKHPVSFLSNTDYNHYEIKGVLGRASLLFGMRLHAMILGSSAICPIIGLSYLPKVDHFYESLGLGSYTMSFRNFSEQAICEHLRRGWNERVKLKAHLQEVIPQSQSEAKKAALISAALLKGKNISSLISELKNNNINSAVNY